MTCTPTDHTYSQDEEVFVDTLTTPTIRKKFKKIEKQELNESKRMWMKLTEALRNEDINSATDAKHEVIMGVV